MWLSFPESEFVRWSRWVLSPLFPESMRSQTPSSLSRSQKRDSNAPAPAARVDKMGWLAKKGVEESVVRGKGLKNCSRGQTKHREPPSAASWDLACQLTYFGWMGNHCQVGFQSQMVNQWKKGMEL